MDPGERKWEGGGNCCERKTGGIFEVIGLLCGGHMKHTYDKTA